MIMAKLGQPPKVETEAAPPPPPPVSPWLANSVLWRVDVTAMRFDDVEVPAGLADANLPKDAWRAGADFFAGRVVSAHLPLVKSFYEQALSGMALHSVEYRAVTMGAGRTFVGEFL